MTITYSIYDEAELLKVANVVLRFNEHAKGRTPESIVAQMKRAAAELDADGATGYIAMGGWQVSAYRAEGGSTGIKASIAAHLFA